MSTQQPSAGRSGPAASILWLEGVRTQLRRRVGRTPEENQGPGSRQIADVELEPQRILELQLEQFPYALEGAYSALLRLERLAREVTERVTIDPKPDTNQIRGVDRQDSNALSWTVDEYLDVLRRAQNAVCPYIARTFRRSNPQSLAALVETIGDGKSKLPSSVQQLVSEYWSASGAAVKGYRDISQHHAVVSSDVRVLVPPTGERYFYLLLPSNPATKALRELTYGSPPVSALLFCRTSFLQFFSFSYTLMYLLLRYLGVPKTFIAVVGFKTTVSAGDFGGYHKVLPSDLDDRLWDLRARLKTHCTNELGPLDDPPLVIPA